MIIQRRQLVAEIQSVWPGLVDGLPKPMNLAVPDGQYWCPSRHHLNEVFSTQWRGKARYIREAWDCDDYALQFLATARLYVAGLVWAGLLDGAAARPWAVGECWGTRLRGRDTGHAINIVRLSDGGLWLLEPQQQEFAPWTPGDDMIHYVRF